MNFSFRVFLMPLFLDSNLHALGFILSDFTPRALWREPRRQIPHGRFSNYVNIYSVKLLCLLPIRNVTFIIKTNDKNALQLTLPFKNAPNLSAFRFSILVCFVCFRLHPLVKWKLWKPLFVKRISSFITCPALFRTLFIPRFIQPQAWYWNIFSYLVSYFYFSMFVLVTESILGFVSKENKIKITLMSLFDEIIKKQRNFIIAL